METDLTGGSGNGFTTPKLINEYSDILDCPGKRVQLIHS